MPGTGAVEVLDGPDGTFVTLGVVDRGGARTYLWSVDDPCGALGAAPPAAPTAPPAAPVRAPATFTG